LSIHPQGHAQGIATRNAPPASPVTASGKRFLAKFTDIAAQAGLSMRVATGDAISRKYIIEANGTGAAFLDYLNDGSGVCAGDVDNDGYLDLYVTYWGRNVLYRNRGDGTFEDVTTRSGTGGPPKEWSTGAAFLDYDRDGKLDLLVTSYLVFDLGAAPLPGKTANCEWKGTPVFCGPRGLPYGSLTLYRNRGDFTFEEITASSGVGAVKGFYAFTPVAADFNGDGWADIYIACDSTPSILFRNNRNGTFTDIGAEAGVAFSEHGFEQGGMGVGVGDYDNDGRLDIIKTNFTGDYPNLYRNIGDGVFPIFEDVVVRAGLAINPQYVGWGVAFADLDHDGLSDIFQVNGHVFPELGAGTRKTQESYRNPRLVYRNLGAGRFEDVSAQAGPGIAAWKSSRGAAFGDFDNDGDIDVLIVNMGETPSLLRNELPAPPASGHWIELRLEGTKSNRSAIGAIVRLEAAGQTQTKPVLSQSSYLSQNDLRLHFGLGRATRIDRMTVQWPSGLVEEFPGAPADALLLLVEGSGTAKRLLMSK
jgi:hypothetical protein